MLIRHRGYTAELYGTRMVIRDWNDNVAADDAHWKYSYTGDAEDRLREAIDDLIRLAPYFGRSWWSEVTG